MDGGKGEEVVQVSDTEYLDAVSRGDMKTAQRMVDAAAKAEGYTITGFHGAGKAQPFTVFKGSSAAGWFGAKPGISIARYGGREKLIKAFLKIQNPLDLTKIKNFDMDEIQDARYIYEDAGLPVPPSAKFRYGRQTYETVHSREFVDAAKAAGYDGIKVKENRDVTYAAFDPSQIKSADPVTYDDAGNVIPLSQRFSDQSDDIRNPYTRPDLRDRLKRKIMAGSKGGNPGQWSARKAQLLAAEYEKAGGGYTGGRSKSQQSLSRWTKQDWRTKSGKPSLETGERYLPAAAIKKLSSAEYAATSRAKREATGQFSKQPKRIAMKTKEFRNPMTSTVRKKLASVIEPDDRILCYDTASGEDFYRLWDIIHTNMPMTKEALVEVEGMLDDDGVLVIESGESPAGLQDHFRKATRYNGLLLVQGPRNPENARIETEKLRRELE